ncbi:MAG TPA: hypothetical protein VF026_21500 [Ktedonobacteraceae bacterium]
MPSKSIAFQVSLRQVGQRLTILSIGSEKTIEETDIHHAVTECHPGAIYFSQGASYQVTQLDIDQGKIERIAACR